MLKLGVTIKLFNVLLLPLYLLVSAFIDFLMLENVLLFGISFHPDMQVICVSVSVPHFKPKQLG